MALQKLLGAKGNGKKHRGACPTCSGLGDILSPTKPYEVLGECVDCDGTGKRKEVPRVTAPAPTKVGISIPTGYRLLKKNAVIKTGDFILEVENYGPDGFEMYWNILTNIDF